MLFHYVIIELLRHLREFGALVSDSLVHLDGLVHEFLSYFRLEGESFRLHIGKLRLGSHDVLGYNLLELLGTLLLALQRLNILIK